jgi:purine-binding chemotaxis protein CheW
MVKSMAQKLEVHMSKSVSNENEPSPAQSELPDHRSQDPAKGGAQRFLSFSLAKEIYAIPLLQVKEVIGYTNTTPLPNVPPYFKGIMNLRGQVISIIDLRLKLKIQKADFGPETSVVILDIGSMNLGIVVDSIESVLSLDAEQMSPPPSMTSSQSAKCLIGVAKLDERLVLLLDVKLALNTDDFSVLNSQTKKAS